MEWVTVLGAWLLFAGPIQQAAQELRTESVEQDRMRREQRLAARPRPVPVWLWVLLPPVAFWMHRRRVDVYQRTYFTGLDVEQRRSLVAFLNRASGWAYVSGGAWLIAFSETCSVAVAHGWPLAAVVVMCLVVTGVALGIATERVRRSEALINHGG